MLPHSSLLLLCALFAAAGATARAEAKLGSECDRSLITGVTAEEVRVDNNTLTCIDGPNTLMAIEFKSVLYKSLKCDETDGWRDGFKYSNDSNKLARKRIANASESIDVKCVEYCAVNHVMGTDYNPPILIDYHERAIDCESHYYMFVDNSRAYGATCDFETGWKLHTDYRNYADRTTEFQLECRKSCTQGNRTEITMSLSDENEKKTVFKCNREGVNGTKWGVRVNSEVFSHIDCALGDGFTGGAGRKLANNYDAVDMQCDILPEPTEAPPPGPPVVPSWTPSNEGQSSEDPHGEKMVIIICCMVGALFLVIICIVATCIKRMRAEPAEEVEEESQERRKRRERRSHSTSRHSHERKKRERRREDESEIKSRSKSESRKKRAHKRDESTMEETDDVSEEV